MRNESLESGLANAGAVLALTVFISGPLLVPLRSVQNAKQAWGLASGTRGRAPELAGRCALERHVGGVEPMSLFPNRFGMGFHMFRLAQHET
jgi:hypothetical protein